MENDPSAVERLNESLNSRTGYVPPEDRLSPLHTDVPSGAPERWDSPDLDKMIEEHRPEAHSSKLRNLFLLSIAAFVIAVGIALYMFLGGGNFVSTKNVDIQVTGPAVIEAGAPLTLTATVQNKNNADLDSATLSIQYPDDTRKSDDPTQSFVRDKATLGSVKAGGESTQTFQSALYGQKGDVKTIKLSLEYKIKGSSATFYKDKSLDISIGDTPIALSVSQPSDVTADGIFTTKIVVASNSSDVLKNVVIHAEYPYGFTVADATPAATANGNTWAVGDIPPGDKKTITLRGSISGVNDEERTFRFYAGLADTNDPNNLKSPLVSTTESIHIARPDVAVTINLGGQTDGDYIAPAGGVVSAYISYQNNSTEKLVNTRIVARLSGAALDKSTISPSNGGFYDSNTGAIVWQAPDTAALEAVSPGDNGSVQLYFGSLKNLPLGKSQQIDLQVTITGVPSGVASAAPLTDSATRSVKIASTVNFSGKSLYSRGPFQNTGSMPPKAEATTTYTVVFDLGNTQNDVGQGVVTGRLGPNVTFVTGGAGADAVTYDATANTVTWNVGTLASGSGFSKPGREAVFQVALKPSIGQIGTTPTLVSNISFSGTDLFTNLPVTSSLQNITTRLTSDSKFVQGDEMVVK